jgi:hypothetical protein
VVAGDDPGVRGAVTTGTAGAAVAEDLAARLEQHGLVGAQARPVGEAADLLGQVGDTVLDLRPERREYRLQRVR